MSEDMKWLMLIVLYLYVYCALGQKCCSQCYNYWQKQPISVAVQNCQDLCTDCGTGYYKFCNNNGYICVACPVGKHKVSVNVVGGVDNYCDDCAAGTISAGIGSETCNTCIGGFQPATGQSSCTPCTNCLPGSRINSDCVTTRDRACTSCVSPATSLNLNSGSCDSCIANYYYNTATGSCVQCTVANSPCLGYTYWSCPAGSTSYSCTTCTGTNIFISCPLGQEPSYVCDGKGIVDSPCTPCKAGFYRSSISSISCVGCSIGSYTDTTGSSSCSKACTNKPSVGAVYVDWTSAASSNNCPWYVIV